jgi:hypothetical protein
MGYKKNPSFYTDFKNVHLTLVKRAPITSFALKIDFFGLFSFGQNLFWMHFLHRNYEILPNHWSLLYSK